MLAISNVDVVFIIAIVLFAVAAFVRVNKKTALDEILVAIGLAVFALAFIVNP